LAYLSLTAFYVCYIKIFGGNIIIISNLYLPRRQQTLQKHTEQTQASKERKKEKNMLSH